MNKKKKITLGIASGVLVLGVTSVLLLDSNEETLETYGTELNKPNEKQITVTSDKKDGGFGFRKKKADDPSTLFEDVKDDEEEVIIDDDLDPDEEFRSIFKEINSDKSFYDFNRLSVIREELLTSIEQDDTLKAVETFQEDIKFIESSNDEEQEVLDEINSKMAGIHLLALDNYDVHAVIDDLSQNVDKLYAKEIATMPFKEMVVPFVLHSNHNGAVYMYNNGDSPSPIPSFDEETLEKNFEIKNEIKEYNGKEKTDIKAVFGDVEMWEQSVVFEDVTIMKAIIVGLDNYSYRLWGFEYVENPLNVSYNTVKEWKKRFENRPVRSRKIELKGE